MVMQSLAGLPAFLTYLCVSIVASIAYLFIYTRITAHDEFKLLEQNLPGPAIALGLSLLGFAIPLASAIAHSASVLDCAIWAVIALVIQIVVYFIVRIPVSNFAQRMEQGEIAPAIWLGLASLSAGVLNAACMTY